MVSRFSRCVRASVLVAAIPFASTAETLAPDGEAVLARSILQPDRHRILNASNTSVAAALAAAGSLAQLKSIEGQPGWLEFDFRTDRAGWYVLNVAGTGAGIDYRVDPVAGPDRRDPAAFHGIGGTISPGRDRIGSVWLARGAHVLRLERLYWTGFPKIEGVSIRPAGASLAESIRVLPLPDGPFRLKACPNLDIVGGGRPVDAELEIGISTQTDGTAASAPARAPIRLAVPASPNPSTQQVSLPCDRPGRYVVRFGERGATIATALLAPVRYEVVDTRSLSAKADDSLSRTLVAEIDAFGTAPDYASGGESRPARRGGLSYRVSGDHGWTRYQRASESVRELLPAPSWYAYRLSGLEVQRPYLVEVEFPDDEDRGFAVALRESKPLAYPVSYGVETGAVFGLSGRAQRMQIIYWPRTADPRVVVMNAHDGKRAAISRIRVYRIQGELTPMTASSGGSSAQAGEPSRQFISWYEEGLNFLSAYGAPDSETSGIQSAVDRWADLVAYFGGTTLMPTVSIYSFGLFRSRVDPVFAAEPDSDTVRRILLAAERRGLRVIPELHPRADFLSWPYVDAPEPKPHLLVDKNGGTSFMNGDGRTRAFPPYHNPIFPPNQDAYLALIEEMVTRYRDSPALTGVSLRVMNWVNPALNNFVSLDWGYDDWTVRRFVDERRIAMPRELLQSLDEGNRRALARARYDWLMQHARSAWIDWRCAKIADLFELIRDRMRTVRPDLSLYVPVFAGGRQSSVAMLREAGIDTARLGRMAGVVVIDALYTYGRREPEDAIRRGADEWLSDPAAIRQMVPAGGSGAFLTTAAYLEATDAIAPPAAIGFGPDTAARWTTVAASPAGRNGLARLAIPLAEADAQVLGDGGNMYTFGQPELREFLQEYRALPALPFSRVASARQQGNEAVVVWERQGRDHYDFYAVNRTNQAASVALRFVGEGHLKQVSSTAPPVLRGNALTVELQPYALRVFRATGNLRLR